ncbi:MAG: hypothetical protein ABSB40_11645 [Nitrososphaeria archaeon]|jgi:hypothetical protein
MTINTARAVRINIGYIGAHASLLVATVGLLFLQRYIWLLNIAERGYGPYQSASYLIGVSAVIVIIDFFILRSALKGSRRDRIISVLAPAAFLGIALFILVANNA